MKKMGQVNVKELSGGSFKLKIEPGIFEKNEILNFYPDFKAKVVKVYKFNWWRKLLFRLGVPFKTMDLIQVIDGEPTPGYKSKYIIGIDAYDENSSSKSMGAEF